MLNNWTQYKEIESGRLHEAISVAGISASDVRGYVRLRLANDAEILWDDFKQPAKPNDIVFRSNDQSEWGKMRPLPFSNKFALVNDTSGRKKED